MNAHGPESRPVTLRVDQIEVGVRLRPVDPDHVEWLARSMQETGRQLQPVVVRPPTDPDDKPFRLIAGAHRVAACARLGWQVRCAIVDVSDDQAALMEADENLARHDLTELDRSYTLVRRKEVYERLYPQARRGGKRRGTDQSDKIVALIPGFTKDVSEKLGISRRSMERAIARYRNLAPGLHERLAGTPTSRRKTELDALTRLPPERQIVVADLLLAANGPKSVAEALRQVNQGQPTTVTPEDPAKATARRFSVLWSKATPAGREAILLLLVDMGVSLPKKGRPA